MYLKLILDTNLYANGEFFMGNVKKTLLIMLGTIFVILGIIGIVLPVVPTTPFLIIAGLCYIRSSKRLYNRLIKINIIGNHIRNYVEFQSVERKMKRYSLIFLWIPSLITLIFIVDSWYVRSFTIGFAAILTVHILKLKTI